MRVFLLLAEHAKGLDVLVRMKFRGEIISLSPDAAKNRNHTFDIMAGVPEWASEAQT